ncbi:hypothetical protein [Sandarakinorhabdus sp. DWP1-3-1]|uniref:hypothetical protein n=1 Tax=Sandarakinorhabdus sp. DWP1-3-1 TaxID=2804627 RepID=UPI003CFB5516
MDSSRVGAIGAELRQYPTLLRRTVAGDPVSRRFATAVFTANALALGGYFLARRAAGLQIIEFPPWLSIERDGGALEVLNYFQTVLAAAFLIATSLASRRPLYLAWGLLFLFIVLDDSLKYHETVGRMLVAGLNLPAAPGLRPRIPASWAAAAVLLPAVAFYHWKSPLAVWRHGNVLLFCFVALVTSAVVSDMIHMILSRTPLAGAIGFLEDGGELVAMACACAYAFGLMQTHRRTAVRQNPDRYPLPARSG